MFVEQDARLGIAQQRGQRGLAVEKRAAPQILAIVLDQVEGIEDRGPRSLLSAQLIESRQAVGPHHNRLAVDREALGPIRSAAAAIDFPPQLTPIRALNGKGNQSYWLRRVISACAGTSDDFDRSSGPVLKGPTNPIPIATQWS